MDQQAWISFVDSLVQQTGPQAAEAVRRFTIAADAATRKLVSRGISRVVTKVTLLPVFSLLYVRLFSELKIQLNPPTPEFVNQLISDALSRIDTE